MKISLHIGPDVWAATRLQEVLDAKRAQLSGKGVLYARTPGAKNHTRLFMAVSHPDQVDQLRFNRGFITAEKQTALREEVQLALTREVETNTPDHLILSAHQFGTALVSRSELQRLRDLLAPLSEDITIRAHVENPARMLARHYIAQVMDGRMRSPDMELRLAEKPGTWWQNALATRPLADPAAGVFPEVQMAPPWLDLKGLQAHWGAVFDKVVLRSFSPEEWIKEDVTDRICEDFDLDLSMGKADSGKLLRAVSDEGLERARQLNDMLLRLLAQKDHIVPRQLWKRLLREVQVGGPAFEAGALGPVATYFAADVETLTQDQNLNPTHMAAPEAATGDKPHWQTPEITGGFRASQYLLAGMSRIDAATREEKKAKEADLAALDSSSDYPGLSPKAAKIMPELAKQKFLQLAGGPFAPHNRVGRVNEEELAAAYTPIAPRSLPDGSSGNVIVGCMKNEAPYILEWVAYHRAIGVDNFLIYTNGCEDGTDEILQRLQELGHLQHRDNEDWKGKSPQQHALNQSLDEPVIRNAEWIIHIDVDEFMNIRFGNGTLPEFLDKVPDATNVAMTWRMFGHNGVTKLADDFVIDQFDTCAPKHCPKPHTAWGFKTMVKNIGAYEKLSCHRPNKLIDGMEARVNWVNGSGKPMGDEVKKNGWRNSKRSIGYDLLQLNHYALRSAESFLIKRQRGRALHVNRSIGLNYWIRMDWGDHRDITIKRNIPRLRAEYDRLLSDPVLNRWHQKGLAWHRAKAEELHGMPEFEDLYQQALTLELNEVERAAYALALDMES